MIKQGTDNIVAIYHGTDKIQKEYSGYDMVFDEFADYKIVGKFDSTNVQSPTVYYNTNNPLTVTTDGDYFFVETIPSNATSIKFDKDSKIMSVLKLDFAPSTMQTMCENLADLKYFDVSQSDTQNCVSMAWMFKNANTLQNVSLLNVNSTYVSTMQSMFDRCYALESVDLSMFSTPRLTNMKTMFIYCQSLTHIDLSTFDTSGVTDMSYIFQWCSELLTIDMSNLDLSNLTTYGGMFDHTPKLESITMNNVDNDTFNKITDYTTTKLDKSVVIYRDNDTYQYDQTQDKWIKITA